MKKSIHPDNYRHVVFEDLNNGSRILTRSTIATDEKTKWDDGEEYPLVKVHISSSSHPFFTGEERIMDIEGRVDKFKARADAAKKAKEARMKAAGKTRAKKDDKEDSEETAPAKAEAKTETPEAK